MPENQFIPPAERPGHHAEDFIETSEETIWYNPFDYDVPIQLRVGAQPERDPRKWASLSPLERKERQKGIRTYVIRAKSSRSLPSEFDIAIQHTRCNHPDCLGAQAIYCKNPDPAHRNGRTIIGGLYPHLENRGTQRRPITKRAELHWAIDDKVARKQAALEESKVQLAAMASSRDAFLIAQADLQKMQAEVAALEKQMNEEAQSAEAARTQDVLAEAGVSAAPPASQDHKPHPGQAGGKKQS